MQDPVIPTGIALRYTQYFKCAILERGVPVGMLRLDARGHCTEHALAHTTILNTELPWPALRIPFKVGSEVTSLTSLAPTVSTSDRVRLLTLASSLRK